MRKKLILGGAIAAVLFVLAITIGVTFKSILFDERFAESELQEYLGKMYSDKTALGQDCVGRDTDGDGYVSCTARVKSKDNPEETLALECASDLLNSGCKTRTGVIKMAH